MSIYQYISCLFRTQHLGEGEILPFPVRTHHFKITGFWIHQHHLPWRRVFAVVLYNFHDIFALHFWHRTSFFVLYDDL